MAAINLTLIFPETPILHSLFYPQLTMSYETQRYITFSHGKVSLQHHIIQAHFLFCNSNVAHFYHFLFKIVLQNL
jgi:hypothetical protein